MKKILLAALCLSVLLLSACRKYEPVTPPAASPENFRNWNVFQWNCRNGVSGSVTLSRDGETVTVSYNGEVYSITDSEGTRSYNYLLPVTHVEQIDDGYLYGDYFFLTDDPNMSYARYQKASQSSLKDHMQLILPTELILGNVYTTNAVTGYGSPQGDIGKLLSRLTEQSGVYYGQNSYFTTSTEGDGPYTYQLNRMDYHSQVICSVSLPPMCAIGNILELEDGGFCIILQDNAQNGETELRCYDSDGVQQWQYRYPAEQDLDPRYIFQSDAGYFFFGVLDTDPSAEVYGDLYVAHFSPQGNLIKEKTLGGGNDEQLYHVAVNTNGFQIYGSTCSSDGDFPFAPEHTPVGFSALMDWELELFQQAEDSGSHYIGKQYGHSHQGAVYEKNAILSPTNADRLPDGVQTEAILPWQGGYVILRSYRLEPYLFSNPTLSGTPSYYQLIATYYDAGGQCVWQTVTSPFIR